MSVKFQSAKSITLFKSLKRFECLIQISWFHISKKEYFDSYIWFCLLNLYYSYNRLYFSVIIKEKPSPSPFLHSLFYHYRFEVLMFLWGRVYSNVRVCSFFWSLVGQSRGWRVSLRNYPNKSQKLAAMHDFS